MNNDKKLLIRTWKIRSLLYFMGNTLRLAKIYKEAMLLITAFTIMVFINYILFMVHIWSKNSLLFAIEKSFIISAVIIILYLLYLVLLGMPKGARKTMRDFTRIGLVNHAYETPLLFQEYEHQSSFTLVFRNVGIPVSRWIELKENIESVLNINIIDIENKGQKWIFINAVSGDIIIPKIIKWEDKYLTSQNNFELVLGEGYQGKVTVDLSKNPHILIGGSTGSGKSILGKNLIYQCLKKKAEVIIADFKGGVDFSKKWHAKCTFITEQEPLIQKLNEIVFELHNRKAMFADLDCANIDEYNQKYNCHLQRIVFFCDEVAEIIDKTGLNKEHKQKISEIEANLATIARLGRAFGIHLILSTQRPDANILSGQIKNNIDIRVCGRADDVLSQIILDKTDASDLIPKDAQGRFLTNNDVLFQAYWFDDTNI